MSRNLCSSVTVARGSISSSTGMSAVACVWVALKVGGTVQAASGVPALLEMVTSGLWLKIFTSVMALNSCQFQPGHEWTSCLCLESRLPFPPPPAILYLHFLWVICLLWESSILRLGLWKKKFRLVKKNFLLSRLLEKIVIWGYDAVEAAGIQNNDSKFQMPTQSMHYIQIHMNSFVW